MTTTRLEAFSDGVLAIAITIMVLELRVPEHATWGALADVSPTFFSYLLSFVYVGIYWNNHHHLLHLAEHVSGAVLWANLHLLFWLSLIPFSTRWLDESSFVEVPVVVYGINLFMAALAFLLLQRALIARNGRDGALARAVGVDVKGIASQVLYLAGIALGFVAPHVALVPFVIVAVMWIIPDRRMEQARR